MGALVTTYIVAMLVVFAVVAVVFGVVFVGFQRRVRGRLPGRWAERLESAGRHLNGEAQPRSLSRL